MVICKVHFIAGDEAALEAVKLDRTKVETKRLANEGQRGAIVSASYRKCKKMSALDLPFDDATKNA